MTSFKQHIRKLYLKVQAIILLLEAGEIEKVKKELEKIMKLLA